MLFVKCITNLKFSFMKFYALAAFMLFFTINLSAQESIAGKWLTQEDNSKISIYEDNGKYFGKVASSDAKEAKIGQVMMKDLAYTDGKWQGKIYAAKRGKWYDADVTKSGNVLKITVKAGWITKNLEWTMVK